jgi:hypothetical protein
VKFLLIDFGASNVKTSIYDNKNNILNNLIEFESPFRSCNNMKVHNLQDYIKNILSFYNDFDFVVSCSIKNGTFKNEEYISWKTLDQNIFYEKESVIGCIFRNQLTHHIHKDHDSKSYIEDLKELGRFENKLFLSCLGDTDCVKRSVNLDENSVLINLGTGSQMIFQNEVKSFFPSGRMFLTFERFFNSFGSNFFEDLGKITCQDIENSNLLFDLNVFSQSRNFIDYGSISNINEFNFDKNNFLSSLLKQYIRQYICEIDLKKISKIYLSGGIAKKLPVIKQYIKLKTNIETNIISLNFPETHLGMKKIIDLNF